MTAETLYLACHLFFCIETKNQLCIQYLLLIQTNTPSLLLCQAWHLQTESLVDTSPKTKEGKTSRKTNRIGGLFPCTFNLGNENIDKRICFALFFPSNVFVIEIRTAFFFFLSLDLWPGEYGYSSIFLYKQIKYSHFKNCDCLPQHSCHCSCPFSFLSWHTVSIPSISIRFFFFQHLPSDSFSIYLLIGSALIQKCQKS